VLAAAPLPTLAAPSDAEPTEAGEAERLYREGESAYRLGNFDEAIEKFEAAYQASKEPRLLYNVGLSYMRRFEVSEDVADLRTAKAILSNYALEIEKDPDAGDEEEIDELLTDVDRKIEQAESGSGEAAPAARSTSDPGADPGRKLRIGGGVLMGLGAGGILAGGVFGLAFGLARQSSIVDMNEEQDRYDALGCEPGDERDDCGTLAGDIESAKDEKQLRGVLAIGLGVSFAVVGIAALTAGALVFRHGKKKTRAWQDSHALMVVPTPGGAALSVRFGRPPR